MNERTPEFNLEVAAEMLRDLNAPWVRDLGLRLESISPSPSSDGDSSAAARRSGAHALFGATLQTWFHHLWSGDDGGG